MVMNLRELPASFLMIRNYDCCMEAKGFKVMQPESSESPGYSIAQQPLDSEVNSCSTPGFAVGRCSLVTYKPPSRCQTRPGVALLKYPKIRDVWEKEAPMWQDV